MYYDLKAIYNPFDEDFTIVCSSPATNMGEEYVIKSRGILLLPEMIARNVVSTISREVLRRAGKEFDDPSRLKIEEDLLSHDFEIFEMTDTAKGEIREKPIKGGKK